MTEPPSPQHPNGEGSAWHEARRALHEPGGPELLIVLTSALFMIDAFLPWYRSSTPPVTIRIGGWNAGGWAVLAILSAIAAGVLATARLLGATAALGSLGDGVVFVSLGAAATGFTVLQLVTAIKNASFGLYIAIMLGGALVYAGSVKRSSEGSDPEG